MSDAFKELSRTGRLPSPSGVGARILSLIQESSTTVDDIASVLSRDAALTGRVLKVANSAALAGAVPLTTTKEAAMRLGLRAVSSIAVGFTLVSSDREGSCLGFDYPGYWSRSIATATAAQTLSRELAPSISTEAFTAGLLLEIGQLGFASAQPEMYTGVRATTNGDWTALLNREREAFGLDSASLTDRLLEEWGLQSSVREAIEAAVRRSHVGEVFPQILAMASWLSRMHIGKLEANWSGDERLLKMLANVGLDSLDLASYLPAIEADWREIASDLSITTLPPRGEAPAIRTLASTPDPEDPLILAVDDDPISLKVLVNCLRRAEHRVISAKSANEALALSLQHEPKLLFTSWKMQGMDGLSLCHALRRCEVGQRLFIVVLTDREQHDACMSAFDAEADGFIQTPFHPRELAAQVHVGLRLAAAQLQTASDVSAPGKDQELFEAGRSLGKDFDRDPVTGLPDRVFATSRLTAWFAEQSRALSLIVLEIDGIASVTSALLAQELTRQLAAHLQEALRKDDVITCTSDGRFLLLCPGSTLLQATEVAERLRTSIAAVQICVPGHTESITISAGVAERVESMPGPATLMVLAETALEMGTLEAPNQVYPAA